MSDHRDPMMTSAEAVRDAVQNDLLARLAQAFSPVSGGDRDGEMVLSIDTFNTVWATFWDDFAMPEPTSQAAEVRTPARVIMALVCPECGESAPAAIRLDAVLTADASGRTLKAKGKTTAVDHVHGQTSMYSAGDEAGTAEAFDLKDIVGEDALGYEPEPAVVEDESELPTLGEGPHQFRVNRGGKKCIDCDKTFADGRHFDPDDLADA